MTPLAGAATDTGLLREHNEDRFWMDAERGLFLVVDGVGGQAAGELAAQTAVETIREAMRWSDASAEERVKAAITAANNRIFRRAQDDAENRGMACVLTLALVEDGAITIGHVGDSRHPQAHFRPLAGGRRRRCRRSDRTGGHAAPEAQRGFPRRGLAPAGRGR
jgi:hypothetical protein